MALTKHAIKLLLPYLKKSKILSLGYPDILLEDAKSVIGVMPTVFNDVGKWHGAKYKLPETMEIIKLLGSTMDCVDIYASRGYEKILDLNYPQNMGEYDLVLDAGTTEHVMNIGQALVNAANSVRVGGRIFHSPPMTMLNHGLWSFNPTGLHDWYTQNGWKIEHMSAVHGEHVAEVPRTKRFHAPPEMHLMCLAQRITDAPMKWITQTKYLQNPNLK